MRINEVFPSIQGEGVYQGIPMTFVRLAGCNLVQKCSFCDTSYAWDPKDGREMGITEIVKEVARLTPRRQSWICITGGEPLWQEDGLEELVRTLKLVGGHKITIETNGSFKPPWWYTLVDSWNADIKCPSSGICGVSKELWFKTRQCDQIKFVASDYDDLKFVKEVINRHKADSPTILVSPAAHILIDKEERRIEEYWNKEWLQEVVEFCKEMGIRFSLQWHKIVYGNKKGV